jgi:hypothetical protein
VSGFVPGGFRTSVTEGWTKLDFDLINPTDKDRWARVLAFYENQQDRQYGRELWVPAHATIASWLPLGPAPTQASQGSREIQMLVYELTEGNNHLLLPGTEERIRGRAVLYRKRAPTTVLMIDAEPAEAPAFGQITVPESPGDEALTLARVLQGRRHLSGNVQVVYPHTLPAWPNAWSSIDELILASDKIGKDPAGLQALRWWLEHGGTAWVMLDRVEPETVARLLGEALDFQVIGKVGLTEFRIDRVPADIDASRIPVQRHGRPVNFVRVLLPAGTTPEHTINGWPVWFTRSVGRGKVLFTTLGPRGWYRPRSARDELSPLPNFPALPVAGEILEITTMKQRFAPAEPPYAVGALEELLTQEIGYSVVSRGTVAVVFGVLFISILGLTALLRRGSRRPALLGGVGPAMALVAAGTFVWIGTMSRQAAPPTVAFVQVVAAVAGTAEAPVDGLVAVFRPDSGPAHMEAWREGFFNMDLSGVEGQTHRMILTDLDAWHWDNLVLPAGIRFAPFQFTARTSQPIAAAARFGPTGLEGALHAKPFANPADGLLTLRGARNLAVSFEPDGRFSAGPADTLAPGHFLAGTLLSDRQQRRQEIYRHLLKRTDEMHDGNMLWAWTDPVELPFKLVAEARVAGTAVLTVPLRLERPAPGTPVTIPGPFVQVQRVIKDRLSRLPPESSEPADMHLRFQLPESVLPMQVERARLIGKINARLRRLTVAGKAGEEFVEFHRMDNAFGPIQVDLPEDRFLQLDAAGGLHLRVTLSAAQSGASAKAQRAGPEQNWTIEYLELEVAGRTAAK